MMVGDNQYKAEGFGLQVRTPHHIWVLTLFQKVK